MKAQQKFLAAIADAKRLTAGALDPQIAVPTKLFLPLAAEKTVDDGDGAGVRSLARGQGSQDRPGRP